ncbi:hypothetical protein GCM10009555_082910 [Acrocarpospora macrocephala]|uniref:Uncharacterized protein n=1 Tax=Acrocarpospora macrocephala TaxID=150177 RepID=A0A5M3XA49_9ACTN|nr:hypothetical protein [Acrocarpospora macrocephala]GES16381.1 hypothetical protein Amac_099790 [Acrocarpospora macrocephala]
MAAVTRALAAEEVSDAAIIEHSLVYLVEERSYQSWASFAYWGLLTALVGASLVTARQTRARA